MAKLTKMDVEAARDRADIEADALCLGGRVVVPVLRELEDELVEIGKDAIPGILRWLVGGIVDNIVGNLIDALESWTDEACEEGAT